MAVYLLRHGEIESDGIQRFFGQTDVHLSPKGLKQAEMWQKAWTEKRFEGIYASDLSRCATTARIIAGKSAEFVQLFPELREIHMGNMEGLSIADFRNRYDDIWAARGREMSTFTPEGGESFSCLQSRVIPVFENLSRKHDGNILIVAHAGVNRVILCHILGMPLSNLFSIEQSYACLNLLKHGKDGFRVMGMNLPPPTCSKC